MSKFTGVIVGGLKIAGGVTAALLGSPQLAESLIIAGAGTLLSGVGSLLSQHQLQGVVSTMRNPLHPWEYVYGETQTGGVLIYFNPWPKPTSNNSSGNDQIIDLVIACAKHKSEGIDILLFDGQRVQVDRSAKPPGAPAGAGTSFTPVQQTVKYTGSNPTRIQRANGVVTVTLANNIPFLIAGDKIQISHVPGDLTLNGTFQVQDILSQVAGLPGSITFTYLSGGPDSDVVNAGWVTTLWADYGRTVYFEPILGDQALGETFVGMTYGTPLDGDMGNFVKPENPGSLAGDAAPNPWTAFCSGQNVTAFMLRVHYNPQYYKGGLPLISVIMRGKNDIVDPRTSPPTIGYTSNWALCTADFLTLPQEIGGYGYDLGTDIPYPDLIAAANTSDEAVAIAGPSSPPKTGTGVPDQREVQPRRGARIDSGQHADGGGGADHGDRRAGGAVAGGVDRKFVRDRERPGRRRDGAGGFRGDRGGGDPVGPERGGARTLQRRARHVCLPGQ